MRSIYCKNQQENEEKRKELDMKMPYGNTIKLRITGF